MSTGIGGIGGEAGIERGRYGGQTWGDFELGEPLGRGPRGTVYRARQLSLDRAVAVKVLDLTLSDDSAFRRRFLREAVAVAQIASPQVAHLHFASVRDGHPWLAMELVDGPDLRARLRDGLRLGHAAAFDLLLQAARGLAAASRQGIVHRDLKPSNLLIDGEGTLKITDFGLVGLVGESAVRADDLAYASPERLAGKPCDERGDIYSLGAIAYELLAGHPPARAANGVITPLRSHDPKLHHDLEAVVMRCLREDPEGRWSNAQALVTALEELLLAGRVLRRRPWRAIIGTLAAGLAVAALCVWSAMARPAPRPVEVVASGTNAGVAPATSSEPTPEVVATEPAPASAAPAAEPIVVAHETPPAEPTETVAAPPMSQPQIPALAAAPAPEPASAAPEPASAAPEPASAAPASAPEPAVVAASEPDAEPAASGPAQPSDAPAPDAPSDEPIASTRVALASGTDDIGRWADLRVLGITQRFRWCPPGTFLMGSPDGEHRRGRDEDIHQVTLTKGFWIADTECSQALWITVMGSSPSAVQDLSHPVERVAWDQCHVFLARLDRLCPGIAARLPSESEWEYACRAGGADETPLESSAWFSRTSGGQTHPIAQLQPNTWGLFDMRGNVGEWCEDGYAPYPKPVVIDPAPQPGNARVVRGGSCHDDASACRPAHRGHQRQQAVSDQVGLRLALGCGERLPTLGARATSAEPTNP